MDVDFISQMKEETVPFYFVVDSLVRLVLLFIFNGHLLKQTFDYSDAGRSATSPGGCCGKENRRSFDMMNYPTGSDSFGMVSRTE